MDAEGAGHIGVAEGREEAGAEPVAPMPPFDRSRPCVLCGVPPAVTAP